MKKHNDKKVSLTEKYNKILKKNFFMKVTKNKKFRKNAERKIF